MTWTKERLMSECNLTDEELTKTLKVSGLPLERDEYSDEEIESKVKVVRGYFDSGRANTYTSAADLFQQEFAGITQQAYEHLKADNQPKTKNSKNGKNSSEAMNFSSMQSWVSKEIGTRISPIELGQIIQACGLPDQEEYTQSECDRVRAAADMFKKQNKSYLEVAGCFGNNNEDLDVEADVQEILGMVGSAALATEEDLIQVLRKVSAKRGKAISAMYERQLLMDTAKQLRERQQAREKMVNFGEQLEAYVEGKSSIRAVRMASPPALDQTTWQSLPKLSDKS